ncbi:MAG TPA: bifunctional metallophosphatase/5'-nucleotidase [Acidimicrobiales bacterium]|nr:bifunctional metallophosphatase/5'-nucleotidase [Acidimicrobiales bacterium]
MSRSRSIGRLALVATAAVALAACFPQAPGGGPGGGGGHGREPIEVQILAINDFHGNLEPPAGSSGRIEGIDAGGAEYLATHVAALEATNRKNTVVVSAGDLIGASPLLSALFHDEPTIEAMNEIGLDINAVGNHEFDEGTDELRRMQEGGCHPTDGCLDGDGFAGADFQFLAANVVSQQTGETLFPPYAVETFTGGAKVAFIGMTLEGTPTIVTPEGVAGFDFLDEADTANALIGQLERRGIENVVVLIHEGGVPTGGGYNGCAGITGPIVDIVERLDDQVDAVISGHTHQAYNCVIDGIPVTSASSFGRLVTDMDLTIDRRTKDITAISVNNEIVTRDVTPASAITALIDRYRVLSDPLANRVIGTITADILRAQNAAGESALGDVIADAQLAATAPAGLGDAQVAFMNPGGIRADLIFAASGSEGDGNVTYEEAFTVQPFGNSLVTVTLTGAQIEQALEQQFCGINAAAPRVLQPSVGFAYTWDATAIGSADCATADAVDPATISLGGVTVDPAASYRVTINSFLATGGDGFAVFDAGTDRLGGALDLDALEDYFTANPGGVAPGPQDRITRVG